MRTLARIAATLAVGAVLIGSGRMALWAQGQQAGKPGDSPDEHPGKSNSPGPKLGKPSEPSPVTIDEAMSRPFTFPFGDETNLDSVAKTLSRSLGAQVVLDI